MRNALAILGLAAVVSGCSQGDTFQVAPPKEGESFLPVYIQDLRSMSPPRLGEGIGWKPFRPSNACQPHDLASLMIPCDTP